jgi:excisionase family DNA binding protein
MTTVRQLPELLNLQEASEVLHVSRATLHRWIDTNRIRSIRYQDSNRRLIPFDEVKRVIDEGMNTHKPTYVTCSSLTDSGSQCQNRPAKDLEVCMTHANQSGRVVRGFSNGG